MGRASRAKRERRPLARTLYHYTSRHHLPRILRDGFLKTTESNVSYAQEHAGPDVVWLLDVPTLEHDHGLMISEPGYVDKTAVRFEVRSAAVRWLDWAGTRTMTARDRTVLVETGGGVEAARHWYVALEPIPAREWAIGVTAPA